MDLGNGVSPQESHLLHRGWHL